MTSRRLLAALASVVLVAGVCAQEMAPPPENNINVPYEFEIGLEGWGNSTAEEMGAEVYPRGGDMVIEARTSTPHVDSVLSIEPMTDQNYVVMRMKYQGGKVTATGSFLFRSGDELPPSRYATGEADWDLTQPDQWEVEYEVIPDGQYHVYYVPLFPFKLTTPELQLNLTQMRLNPVKDTTNGQVMYIDYIRVMRAPTILRVEGCANLTAANGREEFVHPTIQWTRRLGSLDQNFDAAENGTEVRGLGTEATKHFAITYDCLRTGGDRIRLTGHNFGEAGARVTVGGRPCHSVVHDIPQTVVSCTTPSGLGESVDVTIAEGRMPGLRETKPFLSYAVGPAPPPVLNYSNIGAQHLDLNWRVALDLWDALSTTGYWIERRPAVEGPAEYVGLPYNESEWVWADWEAPVTVTNVTTTTMLELTPATRWQFRIAALSEDVVHSTEWQDHDFYGRRDPVPGYVRGDWFVGDVVTTLDYDFSFPLFNANASLDYGPTDKRVESGMIGETLGEGHYGLIIIGAANVENCNQTHTCCDSFGVDPADPAASCSLTCSTVARLRPPYINNIAQRARQFYPIPTPDPDPLKRGVLGNPNWTQPAELPTPETLFPNGIRMGDPAMLARAPTASCGPTFRITPSMAHQTGAVWYNRMQQVREGFDTNFTFRVSNPSVRCTFMDDAYTRCRSRGGEGFAFVVHSDHAVAMGKPNSGMGFEGIRNGIAIEFDTWYNPELLDPWENHVSVVTRGWRNPLSPNHTYELGSTTARIPDLTNGDHTVRITYSPKFNIDTLHQAGFVPDAPHFVSDFLTNAAWRSGGTGQWGTGFGLLSVYFNNDTRPSLTVPLNLDSTIEMEHGRAWVGFTASTGENIWQTHGLLSWYFTQSREYITKHRDAYLRVDGE